VLMLLALAPASARDTTITFESGRSATFITQDPGGRIVDFVRKYSNMRDAGTHVVIDGDCISACTILIGVLRPENVCATSLAAFGFHSASYRSVDKKGKEHFEHNPEISELIWDTYPGDLRTLLAYRGWNGPNPHPDLIWVKGDELSKFVRTCTQDDLS
jgi:hypothetical protein